MIPPVHGNAPRDPHASDPLVGHRLGQFEVLERTGRESSGLLYKARHSRLQHRFVTLKVADAGASPAEPSAQPLEREAQLIHLIHHRSVVEVHDVAESAGTQYLVMDLLEGRRLGEIASEGTLDPKLVLRHAHRIAEALAAIHSSGVVHGNLNSASVFVTADEDIKITDFSTSTLLKDAPAPADNASVYRIHRETARVDIEAFGALLRELLGRTSAPPSDRLRTSLQHLADACLSQQALTSPSNGAELVKLVESLVRLHAAKHRSSRWKVSIIAAAAAASATLLAVAVWHVVPSGAAQRSPYEAVRGKTSAGCAADGRMTLKASAYMPTPSSSILRFYVSRSDEAPWPDPGQLRLFVGEGPTCSEKPPNLTKMLVDVAVGNSVQVIDLDVSQYDGKWSPGEEKTFWVGLSERGFAAYRASGPIFIQRGGAKP
ncbi:protein kinase domain-containing protein [Chondromyces apiculatus]|uniref:Serine/threonine protein kinase n=1 Tax=Chondromyces apiculatus DSM 436 TaxID=1192034 RepID=A0A017STP2_9BACT|nr:protein kinase [Chondromyces apiculatus]EYF00122.1 Serine/threonine protein kinase [Chondromyces apiculatus DSM 436]